MTKLGRLVLAVLVLLAVAVAASSSSRVDLEDVTAPSQVTKWLDDEGRRAVLSAHKTRESYREAFARWRERRLAGSESNLNAQEKKNDDFYNFIPLFEGSLMNGSASVQWSSPCFSKVQASISVTSSGGKIQLESSGHTGWFCIDWYILGTQEGIYLHPLFSEGSHSIDFDGWRTGEYVDVLQNGMQVFLVVEGLLETVVNLAETWLELFSCLGDQSENNRLFLQEKMGFTYKERKQQVVTLNKSDIKSGMYLGVTRFDGLDPMIMWGTGGHTGHTAMTMWMDNELYVMESTSSPWPLTCQYWPMPEDIMKTPWDKWIQDATAAEFLVSIFPLSPENQKKFNVTAALDFFKSVEGHPYGFSNFIFGWIDGTHNYPPPLSSQLVATFFALVDRIYAQGANIIYLDGLNLRLKQMGFSACNNMECVIAILDHHNLTFDDLMSIPEQDNWDYPDGKNMVCDVFVLSMYKAGGLFGDLASQIQATEQTPRDSYMVNLYDGNWQRPAACNVDDVAWCQILGKCAFTSIEPSLFQKPELMEI